MENRGICALPSREDRVFSGFGFFVLGFLTAFDSATRGGGVEVNGANEWAARRKRLYSFGRNTSAPSIFRR